MKIKRTIDVIMTVLLLFLMSYQATEQAAHEWLGMGMVTLVILHQILNQKWYAALFRGKYKPVRILQTGLNFLLLAAFAASAVSGMALSEYAVPFLRYFMPPVTARLMHLGASYWAFLLMGVHLGLHWGAVTAKLHLPSRTIFPLRIVTTVAAAYCFYLFLKNGIPVYLTCQTHFATLDYEMAPAFVLCENLLILLFWCWTAYELFGLLRTKAHWGRPLLPLLCVTLSLLLGTGLFYLWGGPTGDVWNLAAAPDWDAFDGEPGAGAKTGNEDSSVLSDLPESVEDQSATPDEADVTDTAAEEADFTDTAQVFAPLPEVEDGLVHIPGGTFIMGSPETENWRGSDETPHEVRVSDFYLSPCEVTQSEYESLTGENPGAFRGADLPVESVAWLDAIRYCNARSEAVGLSPAYEIGEDSVIWNRSADGYRLPTEAEWEYACRAGTVTPFNNEKSVSPDEANYYGHYPYEIEENYFNQSVLTTRPGEYRQTTVNVGSFAPNAFGLYDMHGNVNEWCWDCYGDYDVSAVSNPVGPDSGTRRVYRGGGWNDFAKNLRSAYRAAGPADMVSYNLGFRLARNAVSLPDTAVTRNVEQTVSGGGNVLIAYFSWSGNTRGIAEEIRRQTGFDLFEIEPDPPYSADYNTVLMQAQEAQHRQDRPNLRRHVEDMKRYDTILLGYPNWWASIPMPIASFLEEYDFSGKVILPFCSHGGGRFGQSLTAIAKLAPDAVLGPGLSIHYSGGTSMPQDVADWLQRNGIS